MSVSKKDLQAIRGALRTAFIRSEYRKKFVESITIVVPRYKKNGERYKVDSKMFCCQECRQMFSVSDCRVDHIKPIGQYFDFNHTSGFIERLWCGYSNLQGLCDDCHKEKTAYERSLVKGIGRL